jgi:hypothetical protein
LNRNLALNIPHKPPISSTETTLKFLDLAVIA